MHILKRKADSRNLNSKTLRNDSRKREERRISDRRKKKKNLKQLNDYDGLWEKTEVVEKVTTFSIEKRQKISFDSSVVFPSKDCWVKIPYIFFYNPIWR